MRIVDFVCWVAVISMVTAFVLSLMVKWKWLEWMQVHAPSDFIHKLLMCNFCLSFHISIVISIIVAIFVSWECILIPPLSCVIVSRILL